MVAALSLKLAPRRHFACGCKLTVLELVDAFELEEARIGVGDIAIGLAQLLERFSEPMRGDPCS